MPHWSASRDHDLILYKFLSIACVCVHALCVLLPKSLNLQMEAKVPYYLGLPIVDCSPTKARVSFRIRLFSLRLGLGYAP